MTWDRRRLLGAAAGAVAATLLPRTLRAQADRVIVVGAGIAGLAAASELRRRGTEVLVVEATDRIGGRIHTDRTLGLPIELGASWIHGTRNNPIHQLARDIDAPTSATRYGSLTLYGVDGSAMSRQAQRKGRNELRRILRRVRALRRELDEDISFAAALEAVEAGKGASEEVAQVLRWLYFWNVESEYSAALDRLSLFWWNEDDAFGGDDILLPDGYDRLLDALTEGLDIRRGQAVHEIRHGDDEASVHTVAGVLTADAVIVTVPLGVLKAGAITFTPGLPAGQVTAIERLGFGQGLKAGFSFDSTGWPASRHFLARVGAATGESLIFSNLSRLGGAPALMLEAYTDNAARLESLPADDFAAEMTATLREMFPELPEPRGIVRSGWNTAPTTGGGYSFRATGSTPDDNRALAAPASERLVLAGEHTSARFPATVHGAWLSGIAAVATLAGAAEAAAEAIG